MNYYFKEEEESSDKESFDREFNNTDDEEIGIDQESDDSDDA